MNKNDLKNLLLIFKKNIIWLPLVFLFFWSIISVGRCIFIVSSREPLANIKISINTIGADKDYFDVLAKLSRAHNNTGFNKVNTSTWEIGGVFVERVAIIVDSAQLSNIKDVVVTIDKKDFYYTQDQLLTQWEKISSDTFGYAMGDSGSIIFASPYLLSLERSKIPIKKDFFSSIINWRGDDYLTRNTVGQAVLPSLIFSVWLLLCLSVYLNYFKDAFSTNKVQAVDQEKQNKFFIQYLALIITFIAELIIFYLVKVFYHPDVFAVINKAREVYLDNLIIAFIPKPVEQRQFLLGISSCPFLLVASYYLSVKVFSRWLKNKVNTINSIFVLLTFLGLPAFVYLALSMSDFVYVKSSLSYSLVGFIVFAFIIFPVFFYLFIKQKYQSWLIKLLTLVILLVLVATIIMSISSPVGSIDAYHFDPVYFPQTQIAHGKAIIQQVPSLYGLFPIFLKPIFDVIGLGVMNFTIVMSVLILITYLFLLAFLKVSTKDKVIPLLGIMSVFGYSHFSTMFNIGSYGQYFQYLPIRMLLPAAILYVCALYLAKPNRYLYGLGHSLAAIAIFWNFDSGIVVFVSWILFLLYLEVWQRTDKKWFEIAKTMSKHLLIGLGSFLIAAFLLSLYFTINNGNLPNINLFFQYSKAYYAGYALIPLPIFPHMWHLVILVYLTSLLLSFYCLIKDSKNIKGPLYFILSIVGFGLLIYFEGRSLDLNLIEPSFVVFLILVLYLDDLLIQIRDCCVRGMKMSFFDFFITLLLLFILTLPAINVIKNANYFISNLSKTYKELHTPVNIYLVKNIAFIKKYTTPNERIVILVTPENAYGGMYYGETNTFSAIDLPAMVNLIFKYQFDELSNYLKGDNHTKIFVNSDYNDTQILEILNSKYKKITS
ncbi:MAG: hypothetical protein WC894_06015, partial [Patescibacteria group bacterium]